MFSKKGKKKQQEEQDILNSTDTELTEESLLPDELIDELPDEPEDAGQKPKKKLPAWVIVPILGVVVAGGFCISALTGSGNNADTGTVL